MNSNIVLFERVLFYNFIRKCELNISMYRRYGYCSPMDEYSILLHDKKICDISIDPNNLDNVEEAAEKSFEDIKNCIIKDYHGFPLNYDEKEIRIIMDWELDIQKDEILEEIEKRMKKAVKSLLEKELEDIKNEMIEKFKEESE